MTRYRIWQIAHGPTKGTWAVAADHRDGKKRTPFIYARSCAKAMDRLHARLIKRKNRNGKPR